MSDINFIFDIGYNKIGNNKKYIITDDPVKYKLCLIEKYQKHLKNKNKKTIFNKCKNKLYKYNQNNSI